MLADALGGEDYLFRRGELAQAADEKFARHDDDDHPHRRGVVMLHRQSDQRADDENFIGEGIEQLAEIGDEAARAGDGAIGPNRSGSRA